MACSTKIAALAGTLALVVVAEAPQALAQVDMMAPEGRGALYRPPPPPPPRAPGALAIPGVTGAPPNSEAPQTNSGLDGLCSVNGAMVPCDSVGRTQFNYGLPANAATRCNVDSYFYNPGAGTYVAPSGAVYYCP